MMSPVFLCYLAFAGPFNLEVVKNIATENENEDFYMNQPVDMAIQDGFLYITDHHEHCVLKLSMEGEYLERIGRQGEGPGEFFRPLSLFANRENLFVYDNTQKFQTLSPSGTYKSSFKTVEFINEFIVRKDRIYAIRINRITGGYFSCLNLKGEEIFRKKLAFKSRYDHYYQDNFSRIHLIGQKIAVIQIYEPALHFFSEDGDLIRTVKFEFSPFSDEAYLETNYKFAFQDVVAIGNNWLTFYPAMGGLKWCLFSNDGKLLERGVLALEPGTMGNLRAAEVRKTENGYRLYLLMLEPERNLLMVNANISADAIHFE